MTDHTDLQEKLAIIEARKAAFQKSPIMFTIWDMLSTSLNGIIWLGFCFLVANCMCSGCITAGIK